MGVGQLLQAHVAVVAEERLHVLLICNSPSLFGGEPSATKLRALLAAVAAAVGGTGCSWEVATVSKKECDVNDAVVKRTHLALGQGDPLQLGGLEPAAARTRHGARRARPGRPAGRLVGAVAGHRGRGQVRAVRAHHGGQHHPAAWVTAPCAATACCRGPATRA